MYIAILKFIAFIWFVPVSLIFPKDKKLWVFGAWFGQKHTDNTRFLYEAVHHHPDIVPVWISKKKEIVEKLREEGKKAYLAYSVPGFFYCMRAGFAFYNCGPTDINEYAVVRSKKIQLWHGIPLKRILYDDEIRYPSNFYGVLKKRLDRLLRSILPARRQSWDYVVSSSSYVSGLLCSAFWIDRKKVLELGYPRHDRMLKKAGSKKGLGDEKIILYAPTHRGEGKQGFTSIDFFEGVDFMGFDRYLADNNLKMLVKLHPFHHDANLLQQEVDELSNIEIISTDGDIYDVIDQVDVLITDYSSIYIDYLVYNKPMIFYCFDLENYLSADRGMYSDYQSATPGPKCYSWTDVMQELKLLTNGNDCYKDERKVQLEKYFKYKDGQSCDRIIRFLSEKVR
jgi:CDP-glycerol glycerophosphotransferase (TagB/SpsB family)